MPADLAAFAHALGQQVWLWQKKKKNHPRPLAPQPTVSPEKQVLLPPPGRRGNRGKEGDLCNLVAGTL